MLDKVEGWEELENERNISNIHVQVKGQVWDQKVSSEVKGQISALTVMTSVSMGLISTTFAWYGSSRQMGALSFMSRIVMFTCSGQKHAT